ncbi:MAG: hypothetical protein JRI95_06910 [Deltaproteobacteria bacterium]|nr:hypothetical protein [Deltaproteobacteria bacterium]
MFVPEALYFPYTDISRDRLTQALLFFERIILYRLPEDQLEDHLSSAVQRGLVRLIEVSFIKDRTEIKRILSETTQLFEQYREPGYLSILEQQTLEAESEDTPTQLASAIRRYQSNRSSAWDPARQAQIFLHFARYLDRQADEVNELMRKIDQKGNLIEDLLGIEGTINAQVKSVQEDPGLGFLPHRLTAWGHFYAAHGNAGEPLFSDRREAIDRLDQTMARTRPRPDLSMDRRTEALEPFLEIKLPDTVMSTSFDEIETRRQELRGRLSPEWFTLISQVISQTWSRENLVDLKERFSTLVRELQLNPHPDAGESSLTLYGYLLPGTDLKQAYLEAVGLAPGLDETQVFCGPIFEIRLTRA